MRKIRKIGKKKIIICAAVFVVIAAGITVAITVVHSRKDTTYAFNQQSTVSLEKMDLTKSISATGTIESRKSKSVSVAVENVEIKKLLAQVGDSVKKGDTLVQFDENDLKEALSEAEENLSDTRTSANQEIADAKKQYNSAVDTKKEDATSQAKKVAEAKKAKKEAQAAVRQARAKLKAAKTTQERQTCQENLTKAEEGLEQAESALETAKENKKSSLKQNASSVDNASSALKTARSSARKNIKEAQKTVDEAQEALDKCSMTAPISGVVTAVNGEEGDIYSGDTLFQIDDTSAYIVTTSVDEYDISSVETGQKVVILTEATDEDELEGEISFVAPSTQSSSETSGNQSSTAEMASTSSNSSGGYEVKINLSSKDERLRLGLTAKCSIILDEAEDVYAVPYDAVHEDTDGSSYISVIDNDSAEFSEHRGDRDEADQSSGRKEAKDTANTKKIAVEKGMESDYYVEISGDDLADGLQVVVPTDSTSESSDSSDESSGGFGIPGLGGDAGGNPGGGRGAGGMQGGGRP